MNFIGVEFYRTTQTPLPNGSQFPNQFSESNNFLEYFEQARRPDAAFEEMSVKNSAPKQPVSEYEQESDAEIEAAVQDPKKSRSQASISSQDKNSLDSKHNSAIGKKPVAKPETSLSGEALGKESATSREEHGLKTVKNNDIKDPDGKKLPGSKTEKGLLAGQGLLQKDAGDIADSDKAEKKEVPDDLLLDGVRMEKESATLHSIRNTGLQEEAIEDASILLTELISAELELEKLAEDKVLQREKSDLRVAVSGNRDAGKLLQSSEIHSSESGGQDKDSTLVRVMDLREQVKLQDKPDSVVLQLDKAEGTGVEQDLQESRISPQMSVNSPAQIREQQLPQSAELGRFARFLKEQGNADIVKDAKLLLKDESSGEIRLILKPERLGEVRIRLSLEDNRIAGRIFVENSNVRDCFSNMLPDLLKEFENSGFENGGLDVFVRQDNSDGRQKNEQHPGLSRNNVAVSFETQVADSNRTYAENLVNLMV